METQKACAAVVPRSRRSLDSGSDVAVGDFLRSKTDGECLLPVHGTLPVLFSVRMDLWILYTLLLVAMDIPALRMGPSA